MCHPIETRAQATGMRLHPTLGMVKALAAPPLASQRP